MGVDDVSSTNTTTGWGGARPGSGRPKQNVRISLEAARLLAELTRLWNEEGPHDPTFTPYIPDRVVEALIYSEATRRMRLSESQRERLIVAERGEKRQDDANDQE